jgi:protein-tyrosine phosphatase
LILFIILTWGGIINADETAEETQRATFLTNSLIEDIEALRAELRHGGGLEPETERAIQSWIDWAEANLHSDNKFLLYKTVDVLGQKRQELEKLVSVRKGVPDSLRLIEDEGDILPYEVLHNLHVIDGIVLSGSQPTERGYRYLKKKGVTTIINWRKEDDSERRIVEDLGLRYYYIPITPAHPPGEEQAEKFLEIIEEVQNKGEKLYHHCLHGVGRCFTMNAAYLITQGMPAEQAIEEGLKLAKCWPIEQEEKLKEQGIKLEEAGLNSFTPQFDFLRNFELLYLRKMLR